MENNGCLWNWLCVHLYDTWGTTPNETGTMREKS